MAKKKAAAKKVAKKAVNKGDRKSGKSHPPEKIPAPPSTKEKSLAKSLELKEKYVFNKEDDKYITYMSGAAKPIVVAGDQHRNMKRTYCSESDPRPVEEICLSNSFPLHLFAEYARVHSWGRNNIILTNEEILENPVEKSVEEIIGHKKFEILQEIQKKSWKETEEDAKLWKDFKRDKVDPFESALNKWEPPEVTHRLQKKTSKKTGSWFVLGFSDFQIGSQAIDKYLFRQESWSTEKATKAVDALFENIVEDIKNFNFEFEGCVLMLAGDLFHGLKGLTEKGTRLECDVLRDDQVIALLDILTRVVSRLGEVFQKVEIHSVRGNHDGTDHFPVMIALENYFKGVKDHIKFNVYSERTALFKVNNTLILLDHGASDIFSSDVPRNGKPRESYIQSLLLAHPEELVGVNQKLFIQGDKHHYEQIEFNDFEFIMLGALPLGDQYSDNLNLNSRARQNCFVINNDGLKCALHYYVK